MLRFIDSFDHYATGDLLEKWSSLSGGMVISAGSGRRGTAAASNNATAASLGLALDAQATWIWGCAVRGTVMPASVNATLFTLWQDDTLQLECKVLIASGALRFYRGGTTFGVVLGTTPPCFQPGNYQYLEFFVHLSATAGEIRVQRNGASFATLTGLNTAQDGIMTANTIVLGGTASQQFGTLSLDDVYVCDGTGAAPYTAFLGDCRVDALYPNADGTYAAWTPSAGTAHYGLVDEHPPTDDTDYVDTSTGGARDSYQLEPLPTMPSPEVLAVQAVISARKDDVDDIRLSPLLVSGATTAVAATAHALSTVYTYTRDLWTADPAGGAWTEAAINSLQVGVERRV